MKKWILYIIALGFSSYWASNLLLWFPWSYNPTLGITLMLTVVPLLWAYATFLALKTYPNEGLLKGALQIASIFLVLAVILDYIFFGLIRNAMDDLYHPTTFYGYAFLVFWPLLLALIFRKNISQRKKDVTKTDFVRGGMFGLLCFGTVTLIILLRIEI
ncbi:hypothetical protein AB1A65_01865 [Muricauda sp. ANG21]|uniref:hypothetical protein n=1 Tax=Allomuricauda sp. ANG21 TaxID=3042468 RepID=UPI0034513316